MTKKFIDLEAYNALLNANGLVNALPSFGSPVGDATLNKIVSDGGYKIVHAIADVAVGMVAYDGNKLGVVTDILGTTERIEVTYPVAHKPDYATAPSPIVITYNVTSNTNADTDGTERQEIPNAITGLGVVILAKVKVLEIPFSQIAVADGTGTADGVDTEAVTVTLFDSDGVQQSAGGATVVISATGSAVVGSITDVTDGTYTCTVTNTVAEATVLTFTVNGTAVNKQASIVWS